MLSKNWLVGEPRKAITLSTEVLIEGLKINNNINTKMSYILLVGE